MEWRHVTRTSEIDGNWSLVVHPHPILRNQVKCQGDIKIREMPYQPWNEDGAPVTCYKGQSISKTVQRKWQEMQSLSPPCLEKASVGSGEWRMVYQHSRKIKPWFAAFLPWLSRRPGEKCIDLAPARLLKQLHHATKHGGKSASMMAQNKLLDWTWRV